MTGKERLERILRKQPVDRLSWTTHLDRRSREAMPAPYREMPLLEFYREIGCDILQFGNYGLTAEAAVPSPSRLVRPDAESVRCERSDGTVVTEVVTPWGVLRYLQKDAHPRGYPVGSLEELRILKRLWLESHHEEAPGMEEPYERALREIGEDGVYVPTVGPSPVQRLLQFETGVANFYHLLQDHPAEVEELLEVMHRHHLAAYEILARRTPAPAIMAMENTSTTMISPAVYRKYSLPQIRDYVKVIHEQGKLAALHMCGLLKGLLPLIRETGLDAINALTEPPLGDIYMSEVLDAYGEDFVILGGIFKSEVFHREGITREGLSRALDEFYTPRLRRANLVLWLQADGIPTPVERFLAVREWMDKNGRL